MDVSCCVKVSSIPEGGSVRDHGMKTGAVGGEDGSPTGVPLGARCRLPDPPCRDSRVSSLAGRWRDGIRDRRRRGSMEPRGCWRRG